MKINSARTFVARRCKSFDMPRASPVKSMTRLTPSATPATLTSVRIGLWRMFEVTRLSICSKVLTHCRWSITQPQIFADERKLQSAFIRVHLRPIQDLSMKTRKFSSLVYSLATLIIVLALVLVGRSFAPERVQITILGTTDL